LPNITGRTPEEQNQQIVAYLRQLVNDLNAILDEIALKTGGENNGR
jgi:hypothetical protein